MRYKSLYLPLLFFCSTALLIGLSTSVHADCSQGGCPKGQRCAGDGKSLIFYAESDEGRELRAVSGCVALALREMIDEIYFE
jgi:hypothetical protein